jgi:hypothetical protein
LLALPHLCAAVFCRDRSGCLHLAAADVVEDWTTGQLANLAAAHPEAYTALMDCVLRAPLMHAADMLTAGNMIEHADGAMLSSDAFMGNTVAVAGLASAITSLVKRAVQCVRDACGMQQQRQQLAEQSLELAAACYPAAVRPLVRDFLGTFSRGVYCAAIRTTLPAVQNSSSDSSSSCSTTQAAASAALLAVVLARSVVQLADAMEAAGGAQLLFDCQGRQSAFNIEWSLGGLQQGLETGAVVPPGSAAQQTVESQWQFWQLSVLYALQPLTSAMGVLGMLELPGVAEDRAAAAAAVAAASTDVTASSSGSGQESSANSSSSSSSRSKWGHLLHLQQFSPDWAAAAEAFDEKWPRWWEEDARDTFALVFDGTPLLLEDVRLLYDDALQLTRELVDAVPLPVVCNNPGCDSLAGVSEAAACCKACAVCKCRYCSVACQRADWKRHKAACKRMAAAGMTCA